MFGDAEAYERFMGRWSRQLAPLLVDFAGIPDTGRVLDVGSGTGALTDSVARKRTQCELLGIDPSQEYVAFANSRNAYPVRVRFEVGDAQALRFAAGTFQSCLSLLVFNFIPDRNKALTELIRVAKPGGCIAAAVWDYGVGMRMLRSFWDAAVAVDATASKLDERHMPLCRDTELEALWKRHKLTQVTQRPLDFSMRFASFADYWEPFLLGQGPAGSYVRKLDAGNREKLRAEVQRRLELPRPDQPFSLPSRAWAVRGIVAAR
ncbi:MAG: class I SAM-dependent methyltransferase [Acidobacteria bacterium]|nr:class I SAM-dependent methyltransferase [Acidobacteriota bacterium]